MDDKQKIWDIYEEQHLAVRDHSSIGALAKHRGVTAGVEYAEAFLMLKEVA